MLACPSSATWPMGQPSTVLVRQFVNALVCRRRLFMGSAASFFELTSGASDVPIYNQTLTSQYDILTPENCLKWAYVEPELGV